MPELFRKEKYNISKTQNCHDRFRLNEVGVLNYHNCLYQSQLILGKCTPQLRKVTQTMTLIMLNKCNTICHAYVVNSNSPLSMLALTSLCEKWMLTLGNVSASEDQKIKNNRRREVSTSCHWKFTRIDSTHKSFDWIGAVTFSAQLQETGN